MPKVMIIDDDRAMTSLLKTLLELEDEPFDVHISSLGEQAMEDAHQTLPDVFLVDYHLKDMNGVELVEYFRNQDTFANTPIVMASGLDVEQEALAAGVNVFLLKPFEPGEIADVFMSLIDG